jgi:hypothetical protein
VNRTNGNPYVQTTHTPPLSIGPSDPGVSDHLRVATVDYEDQFELVVCDVPPAENTACVASVAATYVDALGSTLDLSGQSLSRNNQVLLLPYIQVQAPVSCPALIPLWYHSMWR